MEVKIYTFICITICIVFGLRIFNFSKSVYLFFLYSFLSGIIMTHFPYQAYPTIDKVGYANLSGIVKSCILLTVFPMMLVKSINLKYPLIITGIISSLITIYHYFSRGSGLAYGLMTNTSMEATFLSILLPLMFNLKISKYWGSLVIALFCTAIFMTTSSVGIAGLLVGMSVYFILTKKWKSLFVPIAVFIAGAIKYQSIILDPNGRMEIWKLSMSKWTENFSLITGSGFGTYGGFGPWIQRVYQKAENGGWIIYPNLHSDFLQLIFELGLFGCLLAIIAGITTLKKSYKKPYLFASISVYIFACLINMPSRYMLTGILGFYLLSETND